MISGTIVLCTVGADSDLPDTIAIGNHHVPKWYGLPFRGSRDLLLLGADIRETVSHVVVMGLNVLVLQ